MLAVAGGITNRLQRRVGATSTSAFDLLVRIDRDCVGALQLLPEDQDCDVRYVQAETLDDEKIQVLLKGCKSAPLGGDREADFCLCLFKIGCNRAEETAFHSKFVGLHVVQSKVA